MIKFDKAFQKKLGAHIRQKRVAKKLTGSELARRTRLSKSMVSQVENGVNSASLQSLIEIARVLRLDLNKIIYKRLPQVCTKCDGSGYV